MTTLMLDRYLFFALLLAIFITPLVVSLSDRFRFPRFWPGLFPGIALMLLPMIPWDVWFTAKSIWGYNDDHVFGLYLVNVPIEKWLYFIALPYICAYFYEALNHFLPRSPLKPAQRFITSLLILGSFLLCALFFDRLYTFSVFSLLCLLLLWHLLINQSEYIGQYFLAFLFHLVPFLALNGAFNGTFSGNPMMWHAKSEILGYYILSFPVEDIAYSMIITLLAITIMEEMKIRRPTGVLTVG